MKRTFFFPAAGALFFLAQLYSCCDCPPQQLIPVESTTVTLPEPASNNGLLRYVDITVNYSNEIRFNDTIYTDLEVLEQKMGENFDPLEDRFRLSCDRNAKAYSIFDVMKICNANDWKMILVTEGE
jgi:hypothetical protein